MAIIFTLTPQSDNDAASSNIARTLTRERGIQSSALQFPPLDLSARPHLWVLQSFRHLADAIDEAAQPDGHERLRRAAVIVDITTINDLNELDPLSTTGNPYATVVALLVLAFPEIHWMFVGPHDDDLPDFAETHLLGRHVTADRVMSLYEQGLVSLFDPTGLRERIRSRVRNATERDERVAAYVPTREAVAVAMDEEQDYAFINAYVAYRFGYRCHALTSYESAVRVLRSDLQQLFAKAGEVFEREGRVSTGHYLEALMSMYGKRVKRLCPASDVSSFLQTPDFAQSSHQSSSTSRAEVERELLAKANTYAHEQQRHRAGLRDVAAVLLQQYGFTIQDENWSEMGGSEIVLTLEDRYLNFSDKDPELNSALSNLLLRNEVFGKLQEVPYRVFVTTGHEKGVSSPSFGHKIKGGGRGRGHEEPSLTTVYKPWSGIFDMRKQVKALSGVEWFVWPPVTNLENKTVSGGHSAHGRLLLVADRLIARAQRIVQASRTVPNAVHGAVLALEAKEYLGHHTPTTSLEALSLQHQLEVLAECQFYGVEHNMNVTGRLADIERELTTISEWFRPSKRNLSRLNAELRIVSELLLIFREHSQFDEEQQALIKLRTLHRGLWVRRHRRWAWMLWPLRAYIETLLSSLGWVLGAFVFWIAVFSLLYVVTGHGGMPYWPDRYWHGFVDTMISFVGLSPPHDFDRMWESPGAMRVCMAAFSLGFLHLGIFITHLYAILARR